MKYINKAWVKTIEMDNTSDDKKITKLLFDLVIGFSKILRVLQKTNKSRKYYVSICFKIEKAGNSEV